MSSLQLGLPLLWTEAQARGVDLATVVGWTATAPADLVGLGDRGRLAPGLQADLVVFAPDESFVVDPAALHHKNPVTPYAGRQLTGVVRRSYLRGREIGQQPNGRLLRRGPRSAG